MMKKYLMDTHALLFWVTRNNVSKEFVRFFDSQRGHGVVWISSISFWEIALLSKKGRIQIEDVHSWSNDLLINSDIQVMNPDASNMVDSVLLPDFHKDPFDRILIVQAIKNGAILVTKDEIIRNYPVETFWL